TGPYGGRRRIGLTGLRLEVERERRCRPAQLVQRLLLELADALGSEPEAAPDLAERPGRGSVESEAHLEDAPEPRRQPGERARELREPHAFRRGLFGTRPVVCDPVAERLAVRGRGVETDRVVRELEELVDALRRNAGRLGELGRRRLAVHDL